MMGGMEKISLSYRYYTVRVYTSTCFGYVFDVSSLTTVSLCREGGEGTA